MNKSKYWKLVEKIAKNLDAILVGKESNEIRLLLESNELINDNGEWTFLGLDCLNDACRYKLRLSKEKNEQESFENTDDFTLGL